MKISQAEYRIVASEIAERLKDTVYFSAESKANEMLHELGFYAGARDKEYDNTDFTLTFEITIMMADIRQIVARQRRQKGKKWT